jgi:ubiquinol-cytochrome c reductase cytochrome b subunit
VASILIFAILPFRASSKFRANFAYPLNKIIFWTFASVSFILTWIGGRPVEEPFILIGQIITVAYFRYFLLRPAFYLSWDTKS